MESTAAPKPKLIMPSNLDADTKILTSNTSIDPSPIMPSPPSPVGTQSNSDNPPKQAKCPPEAPIQSKPPMPPSKPPTPGKSFYISSVSLPLNH